jgi:hypothetical protein
MPFTPETLARVRSHASYTQPAAHLLTLARRTSRRLGTSASARTARRCWAPDTTSCRATTPSTCPVRPRAQVACLAGPCAEHRVARVAGHALHYYFTVNSRYVRNKLKLLLCPFTLKGHWNRGVEQVRAVQQTRMRRLNARRRW